ncbi:Glycosyltransferase, catalytic subunit of cellulose synthase and poly-beta-1,6-N-acetylglucosamine synthase [Nannocystis exedens]|uniref:Glycosyltransferase, catalytic subunit of cellulose synthase and poly-beta-1,6-N-acetylglucosamine synthase n=1 Tax=Nannocystis exedens TaxID=54 RepID=A0A1I1X393_9BACT|nr:glycosyltransferase family 2 protein [Nannocystis exedens]PCC70831.1 GalNAc(5)-diNAcBac-PP-undecaprenol beta-1,3-glucosyltransferase [Nannocystis exedens]SFE01812.1 Glycosyltransferase, catalytic subunit of cellulose synthase and poly-beta-1,6-N-acetylglucosamine synthase [Nannocystis exedens]
MRSWTSLFVALSASWWLFQTFRLARAIAGLPRVADMPRETRPAWPRLSLVVPARNESTHLGEAVRTRLAEGYPELEVVVVDDRSDDDTGAIADRLAASDRRVTVVHVDALPDGWLGKVHAMQRGLDRASGDWVLFSDADIHLAPGTLERVIAWAEREGVDHVAALPSMTARRSLEPTLVGFFRMLTTLVPLTAVADPAAKTAAGSGAFNLVRRSALDRSPGLEWLKMEIADDFALGVMLKRSGARQAMVVGGEFVRLEFYPSFAVFQRSLERTGANESAPAVIAVIAVLVLLELGWLAGFTQPGPARWLALATFAVAASTQYAASRWLSMPRWPAVLPGASIVPLGWVLVRSAVLAWRRGGVLWRGTFYPTAVVRAGIRLGRRQPKIGSSRSS